MASTGNNGQSAASAQAAAAAGNAAASNAANGNSGTGTGNTSTSNTSSGNQTALHLQILQQMHQAEHQTQLDLLAHLHHLVIVLQEM